MGLSGSDRAVLTARSGAGRSGAIRSGYAPTKTQGLTPGSAGPFVIWRQVKRAVTAWVRRIG